MSKSRSSKQSKYKCVSAAVWGGGCARRVPVRCLQRGAWRKATNTGWQGEASSCLLSWEDEVCVALEASPAPKREGVGLGDL